MFKNAKYFIPNTKRKFKNCLIWVWLFRRFTANELKSIAQDSFKIAIHKHKESCKYCKHE